MPPKFHRLSFRPMLILWILAINLLLQLCNLPYGWVIFLSNIMLFSCAGEMKNNFYQVEIGGLTGLIIGYLALTSISFLSPLINEKVSVMFVLAIVIYFIIMLNPKCPLIFNNTAFLYFTAALIAPNEFFADFWTIIIVFICGSVLTNTVSLKLFKIFLI